MDQTAKHQNDHLDNLADEAGAVRADAAGATRALPLREFRASGL